MAMVTIDTALLATLIEAADNGAEHWADLADDCDGGTEDDAEAAADYRARSVAADAAVATARGLWAAAHFSRPLRNQCR